MTGDEIILEMLRRHRVDVIFGYPGGAVMPIFDAIYQATEFDVIIPRYEQGTGHMAEGYARATGKPGVILVTSGPGAANTITALYDAYKTERRY
ncbi:acetolactate synthase [Penicillium macrosclerotiorum]|uniref:acetolactate synthase n=1 Tax=Penicillium macrosclerotiorum TaxID=303699 RepID=UPI002548516D|nr:acetolactate synthase [Penicillium macrosclerotiorum]KAJ5669024.1 acetolactate synthase [Penicillium macrosclerotiorum]